MPSKEHCVYRYRLKSSGQVIYIGKTDASLQARIDAHEREPKFAPYKGAYEIDYIPLANSIETDLAERSLINELKPVINEACVERGYSGLKLSLPEWRPYSEYESAGSTKAKEFARAMGDAQAATAFLGEVVAAKNRGEEFVRTRSYFPSLSSGEVASALLFVVSKEASYDGEAFTAKILVFDDPLPMLYKIWSPVFKLHSAFRAEEFAQIERDLAFCEKVREFDENGLLLPDSPCRGSLAISEGVDLHSFQGVFEDIADLGELRFGELSEDWETALQRAEARIYAKAAVFIHENVSELPGSLLPNSEFFELF